MSDSQIERDETGKPRDADGFISDIMTERLVATASEYFPDFVFDAGNIRNTFDKLIASESDPKIKGLLRLIQGLYLARKQHADESNILFYRIGILAQSIERAHGNIDRAFAIQKSSTETIV